MLSPNFTIFIEYLISLYHIHSNPVNEIYKDIIMNIDIEVIVSVISVMLSIGFVLVSAGKSNQKIENMLLKNREQDKRFEDFRTSVINKLDDIQNNISTISPIVKHLSKSEDMILARLSDAEKKIVSLKETITNIKSTSLTKEDIEGKYLRKEVFQEYSKHLDTKFIHGYDKLSDIEKDLSDMVRIMNKLNK